MNTNQTDLEKLKDLENAALASVTPFLQVLVGGDANGLGEVSDTRNSQFVPAHYVPTMNYKEALRRETQKPLRLNPTPSIDRCALLSRTAPCTYTQFPDQLFDPRLPHVGTLSEAHRAGLRRKYKADPKALAGLTSVELDLIHSAGVNDQSGTFGDNTIDEENFSSGPQKYREPYVSKALADVHLSSLLDAARLGRALAKKPRPPTIP